MNIHKYTQTDRAKYKPPLWAHVPNLPSQKKDWGELNFHVRGPRGGIPLPWGFSFSLGEAGFHSLPFLPFLLFLPFIPFLLLFFPFNLFNGSSLNPSSPHPLHPPIPPSPPFTLSILPHKKRATYLPPPDKKYRKKGDPDLMFCQGSRVRARAVPMGFVHCGFG